MFEGADSMVRLRNIPDGYSEMIKYYGNPDKDGDHDLDPDWYKENTAVFELPFYLRLSWGDHDKVWRFRAHKLVGEAMKDALMEIAWYYGEAFHEKNFDLFGGTYNFRYQRGSSKYLSTHSWGIAIDYLPNQGRLGSRVDAQTYPREIVDIFKVRGFRWGGDWETPDAQHFQAVKGY